MHNSSDNKKSLEKFVVVIWSQYEGDYMYSFDFYRNDAWNVIEFTAIGVIDEISCHNGRSGKPWVLVEPDTSCFFTPDAILVSVIPSEEVDYYDDYFIIASEDTAKYDSDGNLIEESDTDEYGELTISGYKNQINKDSLRWNDIIKAKVYEEILSEEIINECMIHSLEMTYKFGGVTFGNQSIMLESGEFSGNSWGDAQAHSDPRG